MFPVLSLFLFLDELIQGPTACSQAVEVYPGRQIIYIFYSLFLEFHEKFTETLACKNVHAIHDAFILSLFYPYRKMPIDCERVIGVCHTK